MATREEIEKQLEELESDFKQGDLTDRGYRKRKSKIELQLLQIEFNEGDITPQGFARKKQKLMSEGESASKGLQGGSTQEDCGKQVAQSLGTAGMTMRQTISKLFNTSGSSSSATKKTKPMSKRSADKNGSKKIEKPVVIEVVCMPVDTNTIPKGAVRTAFKKSGYIGSITYRKTDSELVIRDKVHQLFPKVFTSSNAMVQFQFLKAEVNNLVKATLPVNEHTSWNGSAISALAGQGALYILPERFVSKDAVTVTPGVQAALSVISSLVQAAVSKFPTPTVETQPKRTTPIPPTSTMSSTTSQAIPLAVPVSNFKPAVSHTPLQHTPVSLSVVSKPTVSWQQPVSMKPQCMPLSLSVSPISVSQTLSPCVISTVPEDSSRKKSLSLSHSVSTQSVPVFSRVGYDTEVLERQLRNPRIARLWQELGGLEESLQPLDKELKPGSTNLYAVDQEVEQWLQWRKVHEKPLAAMYRDTDAFVVVSDEELDDFLNFRDALRLLETPQDKRYYYLRSVSCLTTGVRPTIRV